MSDRKLLETKSGELEAKAVRAIADFCKIQAELEWIEFLEDNNFPEDVEKNEWMIGVIQGWIEDGEYLWDQIDTATQLAFDELSGKAV